MSYRAIVVQEGVPVEPRLRTIDGPCTPAPADPVEIHVSHSSVNYKDALALTGGKGVLRHLPMVPGIDAAGVLAADTQALTAGTPVLVNGAGLGERTDGGLAERVLATADTVLPIPESFSAWDAAAVGTAGFTAALAVLALQRHGLEPGAGEVLVTGAGGGVGSYAVALLAALGHSVVASTGRVPERGPELEALGAAEVMDRAELGHPGGKPLQSARWSAVVDSVGGVPLANALAQTRYGGIVAACGLAGSSALPATVLPFILRAVTLVGINSVDAARASRTAAWELIVEHLRSGTISAIASRTVGLREAIAVAREVLDGRIPGRVVVDVRE
ncbi:acryloyl-CoA reductase [Naasia sp. SYSU D00948]|uniref:acrylyl-CoA reductase family protein n=1 Tax=Naasia sp. SYSU D00948 TaxID=2817379 RepID=UPI001B309C49|nr:acryloyl-CoA reductase [Naasia sp. SYSU D00948]